MKHMKAINDRLARELHDKIVADLNGTSLKKVEIARKWGLPERCIGDVAERAGIDLKQRVSDMSQLSIHEKAVVVAEQMARDPERFSNMTKDDLRVEFEATFYVVTAALKLAGIERKKGLFSKTRRKISYPSDRGMAGALSREWLTYNWGCRPGPKACSYYHGRVWG